MGDDDDGRRRTVLMPHNTTTTTATTGAVVKYARAKKKTVPTTTTTGRGEGTERAPPLPLPSSASRDVKDDDDGTRTMHTTTTTMTTTNAHAAKGGATRTRTTTGAVGATRWESDARGLDIVREALANAPSRVGARTFVFKSRNKLARSAKAEREQRARLAKLAESSAFFERVDCASLAEESAEATPKRGATMGEPLSMSPSGLIDALQGLGLVNDAPVLKAKITGVKVEGEVLRAKTLPRESMSAYDRVSNWVSTLKPFSPLKPMMEQEYDTTSVGAASAMRSPSMCPTEVASESESVADTESVASLGDALERLDIGDEHSPLTALLRTCGQTQDDIKTMATLCKKYFSNKAKKIGEGTYGEAFKGDGVVTKIIPMGGDALVNGEVQMGPREVHAETAIVKSLTELSANDTRKNFTDGFIRLVNASVCRGPYSKKLLTAWDKYAAKGESENEKPDNLPSNQLYIAYTCEDGGADLEHFEFRSATEAVALLFQIVVALAVAEEESQFEHRDLHWGNVLIKRTRAQKKQARLNGVDINMQTSGLNVTIIDFTLSRLTADSGETFFLDLNADPELFNGPKKHCQSETYRRMKKAIKGKWDSYEPKTNALWLHYLADTVLEQKHYSVTMEQKKALSDFRKRALTYKSAHAAMFDELFSGIWTSGKSSFDS